jgi:chromosome segregation ATPase
MEKDRQPTGRLQATLDEMKRKLEEERGAAELLTRRLNFHREQRTAIGGATRFNPMENEIADARKQLNEQKALTEQWIQQVTTERDAGRARLREAEDKIRSLQDQLASMQGQLSEQRAAAEGLIQQLVTQPAPGAASAEQTETRLQELENELSAAVQQLESQQKYAEDRTQKLAVAEEMIQQLNADQEILAARAREAEMRTDTLGQELSTARQQAEEQKQGFDAAVQSLTAERDQSRALYSEVEQRTQVLETEFLAAHEQFREQRETAMQVIRQLEADREEFQARFDAAAAESARLREDATKARNDLQLESSKVAITKQVRNEILDAVVDIQVKGQRLLDLLQAWSAKDADINLESEVPETVGFFARSK